MAKTVGFVPKKDKKQTTGTKQTAGTKQTKETK